MSGIGPTDAEIRVLGSLIEKQRATPDHYPLTLNSLLLACNQSTNRDPVVEYDEATVREALGRLGRRRWIRSASGHTSRVPKYRHLLEEELKLTPEQLSLLAVMMLRGAQTPGELKGRSERLCHFDSLDDVHLELEGLIELGHVERLARRPGQKEVRYRHLLGGGEEVDGSEVVAGPNEGGPVRDSPSPSAPALSIRPEPGPPLPAQAATGQAPNPARDTAGQAPNPAQNAPAQDAHQAPNQAQEAEGQDAAGQGLHPTEGAEGRDAAGQADYQGQGAGDQAPHPAQGSSGGVSDGAGSAGVLERVEVLEREVAELRREIEGLR